MRSFNRRLPIAVCAWEACVIGYSLASLALTDGHIWGKDDVVWIIWLASCGLFVVGAVAFSSRRFGKVGGAVVGGCVGLAPSVLILAWLFVAQPGFEASAGGAGVAYMWAAPSGVGGVLAGVICAGQRKSAG